MKRLPRFRSSRQPQFRSAGRQLHRRWPILLVVFGLLLLFALPVWPSLARQEIGTIERVRQNVQQAGSTVACYPAGRLCLSAE